MELAEALAARRSCRSFLADPIEPDQLDRILAAASRVPTAGNTWGLDLVVLDTRSDVEGYWDVTLPAGPRRRAFPWPGLLQAPVLVVVVVDPGAYVRRYGEADKSGTGLGGGVDAWAVPYWWVDAGAAIMAMLLAAGSGGLGSLLFGLFDHEPAVAAHLGVPEGRRLVGTIALGHGDPAPERASRSAARRRPGPEVFVHRARW